MVQAAASGSSPVVCRRTSHEPQAEHVNLDGSSSRSKHVGRSIMSARRVMTYSPAFSSLFLGSSSYELGSGSGIGKNWVSAHIGISP